MSKPYCPYDGSLAHSVLTFFIAQPDEALNRQDIANKWGAKLISIPQQLKAAVECGAINYLGGLYMLSSLSKAKECVEASRGAIQPAAAAEAVAAPTPTPAPAIEPAAAPPGQTTSTGANSMRSSVEIPGIGAVELTLEPIADRAPTSGHKWDPLIWLIVQQPLAASDAHNKTNLPTVRLPLAMSKAVRAGIKSWTKRFPDTTFRLSARAHADQVVVQRIA